MRKNNIEIYFLAIHKHFGNNNPFAFYKKVKITIE